MPAVSLMVEVVAILTGAVTRLTQNAMPLAITSSAATIPQCAAVEATTPASPGMRPNSAVLPTMASWQSPAARRSMT